MKLVRGAADILNDVCSRCKREGHLAAPHQSQLVADVERWPLALMEKSHEELSWMFEMRKAWRRRWMPSPVPPKSRIRRRRPRCCAASRIWRFGIKRN
jgi:hypothetical protein